MTAAKSSWRGMAYCSAVWMSAESHLKVVNSSTCAMDASKIAPQPTKPVVANKLANTVSGGGCRPFSVGGVAVDLLDLGLLLSGFLSSCCGD